MKKISMILTAVGLIASSMVFSVSAFGQTPSSSSNPSASSPCSGVNFSRPLSVGANGNDVMCLQSLLNQSPDTQIAPSGPGSQGNETSYFGPMTKAAVAKFQQKFAAIILTPKGLKVATGTVGPVTMQALNQLLSGAGMAPNAGAGSSLNPTTTPSMTPPTTGQSSSSGSSSY